MNDISTGFGRKQHTHAADHTAVVAKEIMTAITRRCTDDVRPIPSIYSEELNKLRDNEWDDTSKEVVERLPTFNTARSSLYRARRKQIPPLPKTTADIILEGKWVETETGQPFLLLDDIFQNNRILAFGTTDNLQDIAASETFFCDGTFYTCPSLFYQIFTIHIMTDDQMTNLYMPFFQERTKSPTQDSSLIRRPTKKYANIKRRLQTPKERYQDGIIDLMTYADSASELLHLGH